MALKRKVSKEEYEKLSDLLKGEYVEKDGDYVISLDGDDELRRAKDNEVKNHGETKEALRKLREDMAKLTDNTSRRTGDVEALDKSWAEKFNTMQTELQGQVNQSNSLVVNTLRDLTTSEIANKISNAPSLMKKILADRIAIEIDGEKPSIRVLGLDGKPSAMSLDDLQKEIVANKEYAPIIVTSKASGGAKPVNGNVAGGQNEKPVSLATLDPAALAAHIKSTKQNQE